MNLSEEARKFLEDNYIKKYTLNSDGTIDVDGDTRIYTQQSKLPVKFGRATGCFRCDGVQLTSLEGIPSYVGGNFSCSDNLLTSLEGAPSYIGHNFYCSYNKLTSLHNIHKIIKELNGEFYCHTNSIKDSVLGLLLIKGVTSITLHKDDLTRILRRHLGQGRAGVIGAQQELLDAGLDEYARL